MKKIRNLLGEKSGYLEVIKYSFFKNGRHYWFCKCHKCGNLKEIGHDKILYKKTKSCGCLLTNSWNNIKKIIENIIPNENGCKIWPLYIEKNKYGRIRIEKERMSAHRASFYIFKGKLLPDAFICHKCDVPSCVNPDHLYQGNAFTNTQDMVKRQRHMHGTSHYNHKLSIKEIQTIRNEYNDFLKNLSKKYNLKKDSISDIINRRSWKFLKETEEMEKKNENK